MEGRHQNARQAKAEAFPGDKRSFRKSWGAEIISQGEVRFRIWAPSSAGMRLRIEGRDDRQMTPAGDGWFELVVHGVYPGARYSFVLPDQKTVPDPASRAQVSGTESPSLVVDPLAYAWKNSGWRGRPWHEAVFYELHVGTFTAEGTFRAAAERLKDLAELGITAIELMPVAAFYGERGWGYDGVLQYAPHTAYGDPDDMKHFIDTAHGLGMMVVLDVVYNHFGIYGNYLTHYAPDFFDPDKGTPWGPAPDFGRQPTRDFMLENALYWLEEFFIDGLRLDAIDHFVDKPGRTPLLTELGTRVAASFPGREIHLIIEDARNVTGPMERQSDGTRRFVAKWNDDFHHVAHVIATGETAGYYLDFSADPFRLLRRSLAEGFVYQGEPRPTLDGKPVGEPSGHLPPSAFVNFLQNHDQIGNRAFGERLRSTTDPRLVDALLAVLLLSPQVPLLFMGEEFACEQPFVFFCDHPREVHEADYQGRLREARNFGHGSEHAVDIEGLPDPNDRKTFETSKLDWAAAETPKGRAYRAFVGDLVEARRRFVWPLTARATEMGGRILTQKDGLIAIDWVFDEGKLELRANLTGSSSEVPAVDGRIVHRWPKHATMARTGALELAPYAVCLAAGRHG